MSDQFSKKDEAWSARFSEPVSDLVKRYTASVFFDYRLAKVDIQGSLAHAEMLAHQKIISQQDYAEIVRGMTQIQADISAGKFDSAPSSVFFSTRCQYSPDQGLSQGCSKGSSQGLLQGLCSLPQG